MGNNERFIIAAVILFLVFLPELGLGDEPGSDRRDLINKELDCVDRSLDDNGAVTWQDICYSWEAPQQRPRHEIVSHALDKFEGKESRPPAKRTSTFSQQVSQRSNGYGEREGASEKSVERWLREEHPYFYDEYKEKQRRRYSGTGEGDQSHIWSFVKNIDYGITIESDKEPTYYFETVFPLYQSEEKKHTVFSHDRISVISDRDGSYSAGLGYRYYDADYPYIAGANIFYDYQQHGEHFRLGFGGEFIGEDVETRFNYYKALSEERDTGLYFEQAVDGMDFEIGATVPAFPLAKIFGGYQWYDHQHSEDPRGWTTRLQITPSPSITLNFQRIDENNNDPVYRFDGRLNFAFSTFDPQDIADDIMGKSVEPVRINLEDRLLERVERSFNVRTERWLDFLVGNLSVMTFEVRFPGTNCPGCTDVNGNGLVDPGDGFEVDVIVVNLSDEASTGIEIDNVVLSNTVDFSTPLLAPGNMPDAPPHGSSRTDDLSDLDILVENTATAGDSTFVSFDLSADGETKRFTVGPFVVGEVFHGQTYGL